MAGLEVSCLPSLVSGGPAVSLYEYASPLLEAPIPLPSLGLVVLLGTVWRRERTKSCMCQLQRQPPWVGNLALPSTNSVALSELLTSIPMLSLSSPTVKSDKILSENSSDPHENESWGLLNETVCATCLVESW